MITTILQPSLRPFQQDQQPANAPLFSRTIPSRERQQRLFDWISNNPGRTFGQINQETGVPLEILKYMLRALRNQERVRTAPIPGGEDNSNYVYFVVEE